MAAITPAELLYKFSTAAAAGNTTVGTAAGSLGDQISTTQVPATLHGLFDAVSGAENTALDVEYRCIFVHNSNAANSLQSAVVYLSAVTAGGADVAIGVDPTAASAVGSGSTQAVTVADESTAPAGVTFSAPTTLGAGLALGDIAAGSCKAIWVRRTATNSGAASADGATLLVHGDTGAL